MSDDGENGFAREDSPLDMTAASRIVITFADDHTLDGMRVEVREVTPEQIAVANFYLQRIATGLATAREMAVAKAKQPPIEIARAMPQGLKGN